MTASLADFDYHVIPGDILLLAGIDKDRFVIQTYQAAARQMLINFTHVAVVINHGLIADAMPVQGVRIRPWVPEERGYFLDRCAVARHEELAERMLSNSGEVLQRVQYYIEQPYALTAIRKRELADQAGLVCSQFVALVLNDLGRPLASGSAMEMLPVDVDVATRHRNGWRQFPLMNYGLCTRASRPDPVSAYRAALETHLPLDLDPEDRANAADLAQKLVDGIRVGDSSATEAFLEEMHAQACTTNELQNQMDEAIQTNVRSMQKMARTAAEIDKASIAFHEWLTRNEADPSFRAALASIAKDEQIDAATELSGGRLLERWRALYVDGREGQPQFFVEKDAPERRRRRREIFGEQIATLIAAGKRLNATADEVSAAGVGALGKRPVEPTLPQTLAELRASAILLQSTGRWLASEGREGIEARLAVYLVIAENDLRAWAAEAGVDSWQLAFGQLKLLSELDGERLSWMTSETNLEVFKNAVERVLTP